VGFVRERMEVAGRVAVVTGAGSGSGRAIGLGLASELASYVTGHTLVIDVGGSTSGFS
jgi:hypothetical protein